MISETQRPYVSPDPSSAFPVFGKEDVIHRKPLDLKSIVQRIVKKCQSQENATGVSIRVHPCQQPSTVIGDEDKMERIIAGLIHCCLNMTSVGDSIQVKLLCKDSASRTFVRIIIKDNGSGIEPNDLEHILDAAEDSPHFACLPSIEKLIILQDGGICIRSLSGVGTRFAVDFPLLSD